ncbi:DNA-binding transcriptional regulator YdaS (Cro superfamily) [Pseudacidovorax sp. 1753]|uniref:hypothetical protein n=1 Tax=Pseudacidovorax sp. 1753 TaxID=3156419 RepID=UPI003399E7EF
MDDLSLIEALGGTFAVAALAGVKPPSVSGWKDSARIPDDKRIRLAPVAEARGIVSRKTLFPHDWHLIWPELVTPETPAPSAAALLPKEVAHG